jgi:hypothetical protein
MLEPPRVGLPNLVGQGELVARSRGAQTGAEHAAREAVAASLQQEAVRRAEQVPETHRVEAMEKDPNDEQASGRHPGHGRDADAEPDDEGDADGHLLDVMA